jgi:hypothetical protein
MRSFESPYDFYKLPQRERKHLIDQCFTVKPNKILIARQKNGAKMPEPELFFPIGLTLDGSYSNYNRRQGLLYVMPVRPMSPATAKAYKMETVTHWFRVAAFSPDDLDMDLDWNNPRPNLREDVIQFIKTMPKREVTYESVLKSIQDNFGGERTS